MKLIKDNGKIISIVYRDNDWVKGLNFITPSEMFLQVSTWFYDKEKKLESHIHKDYERIATRTQESVYVRHGSMKVLLYTEEKVFLQEYILSEGDLAVFAYGGHGYEILEDGTQIIESKNGPFIDVTTDKIKF